MNKQLDMNTNVHTRTAVFYNITIMPVMYPYVFYMAVLNATIRLRHTYSSIKTVTPRFQKCFFDTEKQSITRRTINAIHETTGQKRNRKKNVY